MTERVERLALHGLSLGAWERFSDAGFKHYDVVEPGFKYNMTDIQAAIGIHQLSQLDTWIDERALRWDQYDALLGTLPLTLPEPPNAQTRHARHLYTVLVDSSSPVDRDSLLAHLTERGIGTGVHYRGVHLHPYYRDRYEIDPRSLPVATDISQRTVSLPLAPDLTESNLDRVAAALRTSLRQPEQDNAGGSARSASLYTSASWTATTRAS